MSTYGHVLLNVLNQLEKEAQCETCHAFIHFLAARLIDSVIHRQKYIIPYII